MLPTLIAALAVVAPLAAPAVARAPATLAGRDFLTLPGDRWKLLWQDEFDGDSLDASRWSIGLPWTGDDGTNRHHNSQYASVITDEDVQVRGGALHLTSRRAEVPNPKGGTYHFTEGLITTSGKFEAAYGYFEMRAKLPTGAGPGTWPAFWMLAKGWPPEMDILEYWGSDNRIHQGTVTRAPDGKQRWDSYHRRQVSLSGWHTYGLEWGPGYQLYNVDGKITHRIYGGHLPDAPHYLLLNSGVESARPPRSGTTFPNDFVVDWVRVYARPAAAPALLDGGFENEELAPWTRQGEASAGDEGPRTGGKRCLRADPSPDAPAGVSQTVYGLKPNTRYTLTAWARGVGGATVRLTAATVTSAARPTTAAYAPLSLTFTTGPADTSMVVACVAENGGTAFFDDIALEQAP
jgi:beta-glucanase (GH16 family)